MSGEFSSSAQAAMDTAFYDINLVMYPIWKKDKTRYWLYVEQAVSSNLDKPYRQRIYEIQETQRGKIGSAVYELPDAGKFVHAWDNPDLFSTITPDSLKEREGCTVFMERVDPDSFTGSTFEKNCKSTLYGATYATSAVSVFKNKVVSWDQGWNDAGEQIWGAEKGGYIFNRK
jgi:hypothetical protein